MKPEIFKHRDSGKWILIRPVFGFRRIDRQWSEHPSFKSAVRALIPLGCGDGNDSSRTYDPDGRRGNYYGHWPNTFPVRIT